MTTITKEAPLQQVMGNPVGETSPLISKPRGLSISKFIYLLCCVPCTNPMKPSNHANVLEIIEQVGQKQAACLKTCIHCTNCGLSSQLMGKDEENEKCQCVAFSLIRCAASCLTCANTVGCSK